MRDAASFEASMMTFWFSRFQTQMEFARLELLGAAYAYRGLIFSEMLKS
jgi:hypothetical protein